MNSSPLAHLATVALRAFGIEDADLTRLGGATNTNFRVDVASAAYVLRLHTAARHDSAVIASELAWLESLRADTSLVLPAPRGNLHGELVTKVVGNGNSKMLCTLLTWVEGQIAPTVNALTDVQLAEAASLMAHLHRHAQQFELPRGFTRPTFDAVHFRNRLDVLCSALSTTNFDQSDLHRFQVRAGQIITRFSQLERTHVTFGLIHADFHSGNYVLYNDHIRIIDFDRCGFGFYLYDMALALMELQEHQRDIFVQGYEHVQPVPNMYPHYLQMFLSLAYLDNLGFLAAQPEELSFIVEELPFAAEACRRALEDMPVP